MIKKIVIGVVIAIIFIQFIRPAKNQSADNTRDINTVINVPADVQKVLKTTCYDCHSNYTTYPWYDQVQPVYWWVAQHIKEGKQHLNFSEFANYNRKKQAHKIDEIAEVIENDEMPLKSYTLMHSDAKLTAAQKELLIKWARELYEQLEVEEGE